MAFEQDMATVKRTVIVTKGSVSGPPNQPPPKPITISQGDFEKGCLEAHNKFRAMHGTPTLSINPDLTEVASKWAQVSYELCEELQTS